ncbi:MAG: hypothetical protein EP335_14360 [Alphaproteobacteria bacterium]|nr:MAG: hypothetical protein EP335_14360 [Alphaproteobacteria bacterium]
MVASAAKPAFLFARQRSGTGALAGLLNRHADCRYPGEVMGDAVAGNPFHYFHWLPGAVAAEPSLVLPDRAADRLAAYVAHVRTLAGQGAVVLDVKFSQTHHFEAYERGPDTVPALFTHIRALGLPVIFLRRRNLLRAHLSHLSAEATGVWHTAGDRAKLPKLQVEPANLLRALQGRARQERRFDRIQTLFPAATLLDYETLFSPDGGLTPDAAGKLEATLGLTGLAALRTDQKKLRPGPIADGVENYAALQKALKGTVFEWMLEG